MAESVLLASADSALRAALAGMLRAQGFEVEEACDAPGACRGEGRKALVVVCPLPGMGAVDTVRAVAGAGPVVAVVHTATPDLAADLRAAGASEVLDFLAVEGLGAVLRRFASA